MTPAQQHQAIAQLSTTLPLRPDAEKVRHVLAASFVAHTDELWPAGEACATPAWIAANVDGLLATLERLYARCASGEHPGDLEFLDRMRWLPTLVAKLDRDAVHVDG